MTTRSFLIVISLGSLAACASSSMQRNEETTTNIETNGGRVSVRYAADVSPVVDTVAAAPDVVWARLVSAYGRLQVPITTLDTTGYAIGAVRAPVRGHIGPTQLSKLLDCGTTAIGVQRATSYEVTLTAVTELHPAAGGTAVLTVVTASAVDPSGSSNAVQCGSTGWFEQQVANAVK